MHKKQHTSIILFAATSVGQDEFAFRKDHDTLRVRNLKISVNFYREVLQLKEISNGGLKDHIRWFELNNKVQIHLVESQENIKKIKGVHMALNTRNLEEFMEHLKRHKVHFENWEGEAETTNIRPDKVKQIYFQDPDGYWIEVNDSMV